MPLYFILFLAILGTAVLLYVGAVGYVAVACRRPPDFIGGRVADGLHAVGLALLWFGVGVTWLLFFNVYPIHVEMGALGDAAFQAFSRGYTSRLPIVVLPYGATCLVWSLLLWSAPPRSSRRGLWVIATLCILSIASTPWAAGAQGDMQEHGYTAASFRQLQAAHLVRSIAFTIAAVWALAEGWVRAVRADSLEKS